MSRRQEKSHSVEDVLSRATLCYGKKQPGFSLLEVVLVVAILSIIVAIAIPNSVTYDPVKLDVAAEEIAAAIRFSRAEAMRTKESFGISVDAANERVRVHRLFGPVPIYDVYHPTDKKLYDIQLSGDPFVAGVILVSADFQFETGITSAIFLSFSDEGYPIYPTLLGDVYMLTSGTITLGDARDQRVVSISPMTGRVTIQ